MAIQDATNLHDLAVDAATDIQKLATGLAHAGANPQAVAQLTAMADKLNQVVKVLASQGQSGAPPEAAEQPPGAEQGGPPPGAPQAVSGPPGAAQGQPQPQQEARPPGPPAAQSAIHSATHALHAAVQAAAQNRTQQR